MTRTLLILALLHSVLALHAHGAASTITPEDIEPKFDDLSEKELADIGFHVLARLVALREHPIK